ncbi:MAG: hypothetical protein U0T56_06885 [Ferruginibacter sp.]
MKNYLVIVLFSFLAIQSHAQYVSIPDPGLRATLLQQYPTCFNGSQQMDTTCSGITDATDLSLIGSNILNLDGVQYFDNLVDLTIWNSAIDSLHVAHMPPGLQNLQLQTFYRLRHIDALPAGLVRLSMNSVDTLAQLPELPASLISLGASMCHSLTGLPALPAGLKNLNCSQDYSNNSLTPLITSLPPLPAGLESLLIDECLIGSLPALPGTLLNLSCRNTGISSLPDLPNSLTTLTCDGNTLTQLPPLPNGLFFLSANYNNISSLPSLPSGLNGLYVSNNQLTSLPAIPPSLMQLYVNNNQLTSLPDLPATLENLFCNVNQLQQLPPLSHTNLNVLNCSKNQLVSIPALPANVNTLNAGYNQLTSLPALPSNLNELYCNDNQLQSITAFPNTLSFITLVHNPYLFCLPLLPTGGGPSVFIDNRIQCLPAQQSFGTNITVYDEFGAFDTAYSPPYAYMPVCNPTNNPNQCHSYPRMQGYVYYDNNQNNVRDINEPIRANQLLTLSNGRRTFTNNNGDYEIYADSLGNYSLTTTPPRFFSAIPVQENYQFSTYDTSVTRDFALQANTVADSLNIRVLPLRAVARPGFTYPFDVAVLNVGTTVLNPAVDLTYDVTRLVFDSVSNPSVIHTPGHLQVSYPSLVVGDSKHFQAYFHVLPSVPLGDTIRTHVSAVSALVTATDTSYAVVTGSFDPNDKQATPVMSPAEVTAGKYIDYVVRFQNTGTDTAFNVVIADTLHHLLDAGTFRMTGASHSCIATIKNNIVYFEFINIQLPDSNINEPMSHGFVSFQIKPQPSVTLGTLLPNKAFIYFDYNSPVITNTAITEIANPLSPVPLTLINFTVRSRKDGYADIAWSTMDEINTSFFQVEMSQDGFQYTDIVRTSAKGRQYNVYTETVGIPNNRMLFFRLRMVDADGRFTFSQVVVLKQDGALDWLTLLQNPVKDQLVVSTDRAYLPLQARLYSLTGSLIRQWTINSTTATLYVGDLPSGHYVFKAGDKVKALIITH